jgi:ribonuclease P protein component
VIPKPRDRRLRRRADFDRVFQQGRHNSGRLLAVRSVGNDQQLSRFAYAIPKRVGNAVVRNRLRRRLREILRLLPLQEGFDVVISARPGAGQSTYFALKQEVETLMRRGRLLDAPA